MALRTTQVILKYTGAKVIALAMNLIVRNWGRSRASFGPARRR
jgi:hypothetical protein